MQSDTERVMNNLFVLSRLAHNDKLMTNDEAFAVYVPTTLRGMMRYWYGENRAGNVVKVRDAVRAAMQFVSGQVNNVGVGTMSDDRASRMSAGRQDACVRRMVDALHASRAGIFNLLQTYRDDHLAQSSIQSILNEMDDFLQVWNAVVISPSSPSEACPSPPPPLAALPSP